MGLDADDLPVYRRYIAARLLLQYANAGRPAKPRPIVAVLQIDLRGERVRT